MEEEYVVQMKGITKVYPNGIAARMWIFPSAGVKSMR